MPVPAYPPQARLTRQEGRVVVRLRVLPSGRIGEAHLVESAGSPLLDEAALAAARRWRFAPAPVGVVEPAVVMVPFTFRLR